MKVRGWLFPTESTCNAVGHWRVQLKQPYHEGHATVCIQPVFIYIHFDGLESYGKGKPATLQNQKLPLGQPEVKSGNGEY